MWWGQNLVSWPKTLKKVDDDDMANTLVFIPVEEDGFQKPKAVGKNY